MRASLGDATGHLLDAVQPVADDADVLDRKSGVGQTIHQALCLYVGVVLAQHQRLQRTGVQFFGHFILQSL